MDVKVPSGEGYDPAKQVKKAKEKKVATSEGIVANILGKKKGK